MEIIAFLLGFVIGVLLIMGSLLGFGALKIHLPIPKWRNKKHQFKIMVLIKEREEEKILKGLSAIELCKKYGLDPKGRNIRIDADVKKKHSRWNYIDNELAARLPSLFENDWKGRMKIPMAAFLKNELELVPHIDRHGEVTLDLVLQAKQLSHERLKSLIAVYEMTRSNR